MAVNVSAQEEYAFKSLLQNPNEILAGKNVSYCSSNFDHTYKVTKTISTWKRPAQLQE